MSEFHNAFYRMCPVHEIEHPKWRKCPKCEEKIVYSEEEMKNLLWKYAEYYNKISLAIHLKEYDGTKMPLLTVSEWYNQNKKK